MRKWTRRKLRVVLAWMESQWQVDSKTDHYMAAIRADLHVLRNAVVASAGGKARKVKPKDGYLKFERRGKKRTPEDAAARVAKSRAAWFAALGLDSQGKWIGSAEYRKELLRRNDEMARGSQGPVPYSPGCPIVQ